MAKVLTAVLFIFVIAWAMGFRFHAESIPDYIPFFPKAKIFRKVDLKNGGSVVGMLHRETDKELALSTEGGFISLSKDEIKKVTVLDAKQAHGQRYWRMEQKSLLNPLFTYRPEDGLFFDKEKAKLAKLGLSTNKKEEEEEEEGSESGLGSLADAMGGDRMDLSSLREDPNNMMNSYMQYMMQQKQAEQFGQIQDAVNGISGMLPGSNSESDDDGSFYSDPYNSEWQGGGEN